MAFTARLPKLLVVDDQAINIQTLFQIFGVDHEIFLATNGMQALEVCASEQPDLVLLDVMMPGMDGTEVCRRLKANEKTRDIPVIFVTSQTDASEETAGLQAGAVDFIAKPVNAAVVRARVQTHLALRQLTVSLEQMVEERTGELVSALERLRQSQEQLAGSEARATLSTLIASVSHELGTPIGNGLLMASTLAGQTLDFSRALESGSLKRSELAAYVDNQAKGTDLMLSSLRRAGDLLTNFRQVAADQASEQRREFSLHVMVMEILSTLSPTLKRHKHRVVVDISPELKMNSQPGSLGQVFINLINNAYFHAFEGREDGLLTIHAEMDGDWVKISVIDNGIGISAEDLPQIFQAFYSTKIGKGGTGLGMAIVENLVTKTLKGQLSVQSTVGEGTRFDIAIPRAMAAQQS